MNVLFEQREGFYCRPETLVYMLWGGGGGASGIPNVCGEQSVQEEGVFYY